MYMPVKYSLMVQPTISKQNVNRKIEYIDFCYHYVGRAVRTKS
jgi:hypothetical protein